jgi:hypothetical protein
MLSTVKPNQNDGAILGVNILNVYRAVLTDLNVLPNRLHSIKCLLSRLVTIHFLPFFFICNVLCIQSGKYCSSATFMVHWFMLASCMFTDLLFSCCYCSCLLVGVVAVCTFGVLQP